MVFFDYSRFTITFDAMQHEVYLGLGSNLGRRKEIIEEAILAISSEAEVESVSHWYETEPWGYDSENAFLNICIRVFTSHSVEILLEKLQTIEQNLGRTRNGSGYSDRGIDIDILFFGQLIVNTIDLEIPHPRMASRNFVMRPLNDVGKNFRHPVLNKTVNELFVLSLDPAKITRID